MTLTSDEIDAPLDGTARNHSGPANEAWFFSDFHVLEVGRRKRLSQPEC